jgi:microcystin-dependent protein
MPTLTINKQYEDGQILTEDQLDAAFASVTTFVNVTGLGADNIQDNSIGPAEIQTSAITETKLANNAVTTAKIADATITQAKLTAALQQLLVPTAAISAYGGDSAPSGWLLCDGTAVSRTTYSVLFGVVGVKHGSGDGTTTFNVPDYRGRFLRGVDGAAGRDPDSASRTAMNPGGAVGNLLGSVQDDAFESHTHNAGVDAAGGINRFAAGNGGNLSTATTSAVGEAETRPKNAGVNFIIKT